MFQSVCPHLSVSLSSPTLFPSLSLTIDMYALCICKSIETMLSIRMVILLFMLLSLRSTETENHILQTCAVVQQMCWASRRSLAQPGNNQPHSSRQSMLGTQILQSQEENQFLSSVSTSLFSSGMNIPKSPKLDKIWISALLLVLKSN